MTARVIFKPPPIGLPYWVMAALAAIAALAPVLVGQFGLIAAVGICVAPLVLGWACVVRVELYEKCAALVKAAAGVQVILLILLGSYYIEAFFPDVGQRTATSMIENPVNPVNLARVGMVALAGICTVFLFLGRPHILAIGLGGPLGWLSLFTVAVLASVSWASVPLISAGKATEFAIDVLFGVYLASVAGTSDVRRSWNLIWGFIGGMVALAWLTAIAVPSEGFDWTGGGILPQLMGWRPQFHNNTMGQYGASLAIVGCNRLLCRRSAGAHEKMLWIGFTALGIATAAGAEARTSAVSGLFAIMVLLYLHRRWMPLVMGAGAAMVATSSGIILLVLDFLRRNQDAELLTTLSGRTYYWAVAWKYFLESIWFGHGYYTSARVDVSARFASDLSTVDNTYLEVILGVGIIGAIPLLLALIFLWRQVLRRTPPSGRGTPNWCVKMEMTAVLIVMMVRASTGSTFQRHSENLLVLLVIMAFFQCLRREERSLTVAAREASASGQLLGLPTYSGANLPGRSRFIN